MAKKPAFIFTLRQRVHCPHFNGVQGVVVERRDYVDREPVYVVAALHEDGRQVTATFTQAELLLSNRAD